MSVFHGLSGGKIEHALEPGVGVAVGVPAAVGVGVGVRVGVGVGVIGVAVGGGVRRGLASLRPGAATANANTITETKREPGRRRSPMR